MSNFKVALVALDGQALPAWVASDLAERGIDLVVRECRTDEDLAQLAGDADLVWVFGGSRIVTEKNLPLLAHCGAIVRTGSGTDNVPVEAATQAGTVVANTSDALSEAVSDHVIGLLFAVLRQIVVQDRAVRSGVWDRQRAWPRFPLRGRVLGLIGFGRIAQRLTRLQISLKLSAVVVIARVSEVQRSGHYPPSQKHFLDSRLFPPPEHLTRPVRRI